MLLSLLPHTFWLTPLPMGGLLGAHGTGGCWPWQGPGPQGMW